MFNRLPAACRDYALLSALFLLTGMVPLLACTDEKAAVKVTLLVILASEDGDTIDPRLKAIAEEVQKRDPKLKSFCLKNMQSKSLKPGEKSAWTLVEDRQIHMVIKHGANKDNRISLAVSLPSKGELEYQTVCGKFLPIVTCCCTKNRERLILAICVQPCKGE